MRKSRGWLLKHCSWRLKEKGMEHLVNEGVAAGETEILLKVGRFHLDGGVRMTMIQEHINIQQ